jgi:hypothetical protein
MGVVRTTGLVSPWWLLRGHVGAGEMEWEQQPMNRPSDPLLPLLLLLLLPLLLLRTATAIMEIVLDSFRRSDRLCHGYQSKVCMDDIVPV